MSQTKQRKGYESRTYRLQEVRFDEAKRTVSGYAAVYNSESEDLGGFREIIAPGAFDSAVQVSDVRALLNHDENLLLARTASGTLRLTTDENGLRYEFEAPNTTYGNDLVEVMKRGDLNQSSFGFTVGKDGQEWRTREDGVRIRTIKQVKELFDVSPVTYPAYQDTSVALRQLSDMSDEAFQAETEIKEAAQRRAMRLHLCDLSIQNK